VAMNTVQRAQLTDVARSGHTNFDPSNVQGPQPMGCLPSLLRAGQASAASFWSQSRTRKVHPRWMRWIRPKWNWLISSQISAGSGENCVGGIGEAPFVLP